MFLWAGGLNSVERTPQNWGQTDRISPKKKPLTFKLMTMSPTLKGLSPGYFLRYLLEHAKRFSRKILVNMSCAWPIFWCRTPRLALNNFAEGLWRMFLGSDSRYHPPFRKWLGVRKHSEMRGELIWIELKQLHKADNTLLISLKLRLGIFRLSLWCKLVFRTFLTCLMRASALHKNWWEASICKISILWSPKNRL